MQRARFRAYLTREVGLIGMVPDEEIEMIQRTLHVRLWFYPISFCKRSRGHCEKFLPGCRKVAYNAGS